MIKLKICGITTIEDAQAAVSCGADYLGFNLFAKSPRYIDPERVREIVESLPVGVIGVGIFVNEKPDQVIKLLGMTGLQLAQLHGDEDAVDCEQVGAERVIKALRINDDFDPHRALGFPASAILLDAYDKKLYGGTGKIANWSIAREIARLRQVFLAGGLSPENIIEAIDAVRPFAVDVNSGVELLPGRKDPVKLRKLREELDKLS